MMLLKMKIFVLGKTKTIISILLIPCRGVIGLVVTTIFTLSSILWLPMLGWRYVAILLAKVRPSFGRIFSPLDAIHFENYQETHSPFSTIVSTVVLKEDASVKAIRELFRTTVLHATMLPTNNSRLLLQYPELQQYQVNWLGFRFFRSDPNFDLENHITEQQLVNNNNEWATLAQVHEELLNRPFIATRSPWELVVVRKFRYSSSAHRSHDKCSLISENESCQTLLALRVHHSLADALSILKLFVEGLGKKTLIKANPRQIKKSSWEKLLFYMAFPFNVGNDFLRLVYATVFTIIFPNFFSTGTKRRGAAFGKKVVGITEKLSLHEVKQVASKCNVTFSGVIVSVIVGALRNFLVNNPANGLESFKLPTTYVLPLDNHPGGLVNHWAANMTHLCLSKMDNYKRIRQCDDKFMRLKTQSKSYLFRLGLHMVGASLSIIAYLFTNNVGGSVAITNIAGDRDGFQIDGNQCLDYTLSTGSISNFGLMFCVMSYENHFRVSCVAESAILSPVQVNELANLLVDEFENVKRDILSNFVKGVDNSYLIN